MNENKPEPESDQNGNKSPEEPASDENASLRAEPEGEDDQLSLEQELQDFVGLEDLTEADLQDLQEAIAENNASVADEAGGLSGDMNEIESEASSEISPEIPFSPEISADLEQKMHEELARKKKIQEQALMTKEKLMDYLSSRRSKIVYHALWYLVFSTEDHEAAKETLYDALKEVTSKSPIEPLEEHKFYFGLGFILRLKLNNEKIVQFKEGKLKITINPEFLKEILSLVGDPISERPILSQSKKAAMFSDFLKDDFLDI